ncbi:hypothetical protein HBH70_159550 [Parastagonospora nodorum]|nr:hypothetical protein HBH52_235620 [Parastagonospora nodorum]KAH4014424.1 hypothetical protein HBI09_210330 [Parastagonospora nodorum]KAH4055904.1 hypothetical protein HBH50_243360 [Parastagonospora nodorum]KAH4083529.1 hypothetical protein HBH48_176520 [Parastagonospora nodorum]KAH4117291.1 hypothetical protein HBH47_157630 [Parastagonospora nodorum]
MALPDAHLLSLPREIRDKILCDVFQEITFDWKWKIQGMHRVGFKVTVPHAPHFGVLLACSRLHDEYVEHIKPEHRKMDIVWNGAVTQRRDLRKVVKSRKYLKAFDYPETVRIKLYMAAYLHKWGTTAKFIDVLQLAAPRVRCVLFTEKLGGISNFHTNDIPQRVTWEQRQPHDSRFTAAPTLLGDLRISRISRIFRIETEYNAHYFKAGTIPKPQNYGGWLHLPTTSTWNCHPLNNRIAQYDVFTYNREEVQHEDLERSAVRALWPRHRFRTEDAKPEWELSDVELQILEDYSGRIFKWDFEERDELLASKWTFEIEKRKVVPDGVDVHENEGFARWFD